MAGAAAVTLARGGPAVTVPKPLETGSYLLIGAVIGSTITRETLTQLRGVALPAVLSALAVIAFGIGLAIVLRWIGIAPDGVVLATSPGALSVMAAAAAPMGVGPQVAVFHTLRIVLVIVSLPLLIRLAD